MTDLESSINSVGRQSGLFGTDFPFGEKLEVESVGVLEVHRSSPYLLLCCLVAAQEVVDSGTLIRDTVDCHAVSMHNKCNRGEISSLDNVV